MFTEWIKASWNKSIQYRIQGKIEHGIKYHRHHWRNEDGTTTVENWIKAYQFTDNKYFKSETP